MIHPGNFEAFCETYKEQLERVVKERPNEYVWSPNTSVEDVYQKMRVAIKDGSFNRNSLAIRRTCKALNIAPTYKAIKEFISL